MDIYKIGEGFEGDFEDYIDKIAFKYLRERKYELTLYACYDVLSQITKKTSMSRTRTRREDNERQISITSYLCYCGIEIDLKFDLSDLLLPDEFGIVVGRKEK